MSDVQATTHEGAASGMDSEAHFDSLWSAGAFDPNGEPPREEGATTKNAPAADQNDASDDGAQTEGQDEAASPEGQEGQPAAQASEPAYASLDELLTSLKVDPESARTLPVTVKIDGQEKQVSLAEVIKSYQLEGHVNNKSIEVSNQKNALESERTAWRAATQQALQQHQAMGNAALQMLNHDFNRVDWNGLRAQNPAEFAALQSEFGQRQQQIQGFLANVQQQQQQEAEQQQQALRQALAQEHEKLMGAVPEWRNAESFAKDTQQMKQYARNLGFQDAELGQIYDHRVMLVLRAAARYQELQAAKPQALKQVRQAPPMAKPGSRVDANPAAAKQKAAFDRFNRSPNDVDAQAAYFDTLD